MEEQEKNLQSRNDPYWTQYNEDYEELNDNIEDKEYDDIESGCNFDNFPDNFDIKNPNPLHCFSLFLNEDITNKIVVIFERASGER